MPVTNFDYRGMSSLPDVASVLGINNLNSINSLLNDDEDEYPLPPSHRHTSSIDNHTILRAETTSEEFPILVRRPGDINTSVTLGTAPTHQSNASTSGPSPWPNPYMRHRSQQSLPMNTLRGEHLEKKVATHSRSNSQALYDMHTPNRRNGDGRKSIDATDLPSPNKSNRSSLHISPPHAPSSLTSMPNLRSSFSTNDVPTISNLNASAASNGAMTHAEQHFHNHNASLGRVPQTTVNHRRELSGSDRRLLGETGTNQPPVPQSSNHSNSAVNHYSSVAPSTAKVLPSSIVTTTVTTPLSASSNTTALSSPTATGAQSPVTYYPQQYGVPTSTMPVAGMPNAHWNPPPGAIPYPYYGYFYPQYQMPRTRDSQQLVIQQRRNQHFDGKSFFDFFPFLSIFSQCL
jgi:hypothetical protein